jgi:hypothetical protein
LTTTTNSYHPPTAWPNRLFCGAFVSFHCTHGFRAASRAILRAAPLSSYLAALREVSICLPRATRQIVFFSSPLLRRPFSTKGEGKNDKVGFSFPLESGEQNEGFNHHFPIFQLAFLFVLFFLLFFPSPSQKPCVSSDSRVSWSFWFPIFPIFFFFSFSSFFQSHGLAGWVCTGVMVLGVTGVGGEGVFCFGLCLLSEDYLNWSSSGRGQMNGHGISLFPFFLPLFWFSGLRFAVSVGGQARFGPGLGSDWTSTIRPTHAVIALSAYPSAPSTRRS